MHIFKGNRNTVEIMNNKFKKVVISGNGEGRSMRL